jgi:TonB-linked SusC/RagA family outer membrane protein
MSRNVFVFWGLAVLSLVAPAELLAQGRTINGQVVRSANAQPVAGALVAVVGRNATTALTDQNGRFAVSAPLGDVTLAVTAFGYSDAQVTVAEGQNSITIELEYNAFNLDELVVTGQATSVARRSATTSIGYVSGEEITEVTSSTMLEALNGKVTGVNLQSNSGAPGGGMQMEIRGNSTILGGFDPLFVVDGVIYSNASIPSGRGFTNAAASTSLEADAVNRIADLNPADIESIEILKGAAASSIYGSKAANGVVVIETTRGRAGPPRINIRQQLGIATPLNLLETRRWTEAEAVDAYGAAAADFFAGNSNPYYDHYDQVFGQRALSNETMANISGGTLDTRYFVSGAWRDEAGIEYNTGAARQSLRVNLDHVFSQKFEASVSSAFSRNENDRGWNNNCNNFGCHGYAIAYIPSFVDLTARNDDGSFPTPTVGVPSNPIQLTELGRNNEVTHRFTGGLTLNWDVLTGADQSLRLVAGGGVDLFDQRNDVWTPNELFFEQVQALPGEAVESGGRSTFHNWNINAIHDLEGSGWAASTSAGFQYEDRELHTYRIRTQNLLPGQRNVDQGTNVTTAENLTHERTLALYAQESLTLLGERLLVQAGLRAERSSVNGDADKYYIFPKVSGSYRFFDLLGPGSEIKLRAAYGETGNQPLFGQKFTNLGTPQLGGQQGLTVATTSGSPNIEPEREQEIEAGIDGTLMDDRLTWELTGFRSTTTNLLLQRVPAPSSGFGSQLFNGGELRNQGIEVGLGYTPILTSNAHWIARGTFTRYTSEVVDLAGLPAFFPPASGFGNLGRTFIQEGRPITQVIGFDWNDAGDARADTLSQLGNTAPDFRVGLVNDFRYKSLSLGVVVDWQQGGTVTNLTQFLHDAAGTAADYGEQSWQDRYDALLAGVITPYIEDATFVKLREVALNYNVPNEMVSALGIGARSLQVGVTGRDLFMWTDYSGLDPEVANFGSTAVRNNLDISPYPPSRTIFLNISVGL